MKDKKVISEELANIFNQVKKVCNVLEGTDIEKKELVRLYKVQKLLGKICRDLELRS